MRTLIASLVVASALATPAFADVAPGPDAIPGAGKKADDAATPGEARPDAKPADAKPADAKPADAKPADAKPADAKTDAAPADAQTAEAQKTLVAYLDLVKKKKWDPAKKLVHPKTLALIAEIKKRTGKEQHPMAPQFWAKDDFYLKDYSITGSQPHALGTIEFKLSCTNYRVQEKGESDGDQASYLMGKSGGKWLVVDRKDNGSFEDSSIKLDYKGYFDP